MRSLQLFAFMAVSYFLLVLNTRAIAAGSYAGTAATDVAIASVNFFVIQRVAGAQSRLELVAYVAGGLVGSLLALHLSVSGVL